MDDKKIQNSDEDVAEGQLLVEHQPPTMPVLPG